MPKAHKVERLFYIIKYLNNHDTVTARELAKNCQTSVRSIYRDMKLLENLGLYYTIEGKNGYRLINQNQHSNFNLTKDEWFALILFPLMTGNITSRKHPFYHAFRSGLEKIGKNFYNHKDVPNISSELGERILFQDHYQDSIQPEVMPAIIESIVANKSIQISYYSIQRNVISNRMIDPYYLVPRGGHLYVIAYCHFRNEVRIFRLSRIQSIQLTEKTFLIQKSFKISEYLANRWSIFAEDEKPTIFMVKFHKDVARYIYEYDFYTETTLLEQDDGSLLLKTKLKSHQEFIRWVRSFGTQAEILEPKKVREQLREEYEKLLNKYQ
jgi:predicted DNA-binding transcriptional regulator YafY